MTRLFIGIYLGVLLALLMAWFIHGIALERYSAVETVRVAEEAHGGGIRLLASELDAVTISDREKVLRRLGERFDCSIAIVPRAELQPSAQRRIADGDDVVFYIEEGFGAFVVAPLSHGEDVVLLGPLPAYTHFEAALAGGVRLAAAKLEAAHRSDRDALLADLRKRFDYPVDIVSLDDVPLVERWRIAAGDDVVFYGNEETDRYFVVTPTSDKTRLIRFGPFPNYERVERRATATALALVLLPAALAIALLLRPVARQLRRVEDAAKAIAAGDLSARVDQRRVHSAKPLAQAFNNMASRTESLVRTQRELLQAVSHELRTPLSRMRFAIELIGTAKDDTERKQRLDSLDAATEELDELVGELLSYVRMETTEPQLNREHVALEDTLDVLIPKHAALYPSIRFDLSEDVAGAENVVFADRAALQRVLGNLLSNAGRFAGSRVTIGADSTGRSTTVDVDDDGSGIPASERGRVFEPFVRLDDGSNGRGAGLGLALVKRIMKQHGGGVEVLESPLGGCRIRTTWPGDSMTHEG